ncbi:MAG: DUF1295 domain-containing protein [Saprospiraceae bacterium]
METAELIAWIWIGLAILAFPIQLFITAPYGRHTKSSWGPLMDNRWGWTIMEIVSPLVFTTLFLIGPQDKSLFHWIAFGCWNLHYLNRSLIYPWRTKTSNKKIPVTIVGSAIFFNLINAGLNGFFLGFLPLLPLYSYLFIFGLAFFIIGMGVNFQADNILLSLRKDGKGGYKIPRGKLFNFISCPNHFGEIIEWIGFALMVQNVAGLSFAIWTFANLSPRSWSHHKWYKANFENYPTERKAVIPFLW